MKKVLYNNLYMLRIFFKAVPGCAIIYAVSYHAKYPI